MTEQLETQLHRAFIAIMPDKTTRDFLRDSRRIFKKQARNFRFTPVDQLHITLEFLGDSVSSETLNYLTEILSAHKSNYPKPRIKLKELRMGFPGQIMPSVLYWDIDGGQDLKDLTTFVHDKTVEIGFSDIKRHKDHAKLIHHLTLGRTKRTISKAHSRQIKDIIQNNPFSDLPEFRPESFSIIESQVTPTGAVYRELKSIQL